MPTPGERLRELMASAGYTAKTLAPVINRSARAIGNWVNDRNPPRDPQVRARLLQVLGEDPYDSRPARPAAEVDLSKLGFLEATALQHIEEAARILAREEQHGRARHDQSNVVPVEWAFDDVPVDEEGTTDSATGETVTSSLLPLEVHADSEVVDDDVKDG